MITKYYLQLELRKIAENLPVVDGILLRLAASTIYNRKGITTNILYSALDFVSVKTIFHTVRVSSEPDSPDDLTIASVLIIFISFPSGDNSFTFAHAIEIASFTVVSFFCNDVLDMPLLHTRKYKDMNGLENLISDLILQLLSYIAEDERKRIKERQEDGIKAEINNGVKFGRKK